VTFDIKVKYVQLCNYFYPHLLHFTEAVFASLPRVKRGSPTVLKGDPKGKNFLYTNGKSIFIRDIQVGVHDMTG
jgi:hypothetical protein